MLNSRSKGKVGELELAALFREYGYEARRGQQFHGGGDSPDVVGLPGIHVECKRVEARAPGTIYDWLAQAIRDCPADRVPVVFHRRNRSEWVVVMRARDFLARHKETHYQEPEVW